MCRFIYDIFVGILANTAFTVLTIGLGYLIFYFFRRAPLFGFFGIDDIREVTIYVSHLRVQPGGAIGADGQPRSFGGDALPYLEAVEAARIRSLFTVSLPGQSVQPEWLQSILLGDVLVSIFPPPLPPTPITFISTIVAIGSPAYNRVSAAIENDLQSPVHFNPENSGFVIPDLDPITNLHQAFVVRLRHDDLFIFYVAGISLQGTAAAVSYLSRSWLALHRRHRATPSFYVLIEFEGENYRNSHVVAEGELNFA